MELEIYIFDDLILLSPSGGCWDRILEMTFLRESPVEDYSSTPDASTPTKEEVLRTPTLQGHTCSFCIGQTHTQLFAHCRIEGWTLSIMRWRILATLLHSFSECKEGFIAFSFYEANWKAPSNYQDHWLLRSTIQVLLSLIHLRQVARAFILLCWSVCLIGHMEN